MEGGQGRADPAQVFACGGGPDLRDRHGDGVDNHQVRVSRGGGLEDVRVLGKIDQDGDLGNHCKAGAFRCDRDRGGPIAAGNLGRADQFIREEDLPHILGPVDSAPPEAGEVSDD